MGRASGVLEKHILQHLLGSLDHDLYLQIPFTTPGLQEGCLWVQVVESPRLSRCVQRWEKEGPRRPPPVGAFPFWDERSASRLSRGARSMRRASDISNAFCSPNPASFGKDKAITMPNDIRSFFGGKAAPPASNSTPQPKSSVRSVWTWSIAEQG